MNESDDRLERIESRLSEAEDQIDALNKTIYQQEQLLARFESALTHLVKQARNLSGTAPLRPEDEIPPHW